MQVQTPDMLHTVRDQEDMDRLLEARTHIPVDKPPAEDHRIMDQRIKAQEAILMARATKETHRRMDRRMEALVNTQTLPMLVGIRDILGRGIITIEEDESSGSRTGSVVSPQCSVGERVPQRDC